MLPALQHESHAGWVHRRQPDLISCVYRMKHGAQLIRCIAPRLDLSDDAWLAHHGDRRSACSNYLLIRPSRSRSGHTFFRFKCIPIGSKTARALPPSIRAFGSHGVSRRKARNNPVGTYPLRPTKPKHAAGRSGKGDLSSHPSRLHQTSISLLPLSAHPNVVNLPYTILSTHALIQRPLTHRHHVRPRASV